MKKLRLLCSAAVLALGAQLASAQVDNYALRFSEPTGIANLGKVETLASPRSYTLQLWFNPEVWSRGASLVRCGSFSIKLGVDHALVINDGTNHLTLTSGNIAAGRWSHLTLRTGADGTVATVNNSQTFTSATPIELPAAAKSIWLGGDYQGRIDEVRLWNGTLPEDYNSYWQTTLNELNPSWDSLLAYWKLDQEQCANIVDYRAAHHGTLSASGVAKEKVTDNGAFRYLLNLAYGNMQRFFDRTIDARHYSLSNRISVIGSWANVNTGNASLVNGREDATLTGGAAHLASWQGRNGVIALGGGNDAIGLRGALPESALSDYAVEMWLYIDSWTPGATVFSRGDGLAVRLAAEGSVEVSVNGKTFTVGGIPDARWFHFGLTTNGTGLTALVDDTATRLDCQAALAATTEAPIAGLGLKGKIDDLLLWKGARTDAQMEADAGCLPLPDDKVSVAPAVYQTCTACYNFDNAAEPTYDNMSVQYAFETMRSMTAGMRGVKFTLCVNAEKFDACLDNETKRTSLARDIAAMGNDPAFDGIDLDFEWTYSATGWNNIALLCREIRAQLAPEKILSVSPHSVAFAYPVDKMDVVDYFNFQIYGPGDKDLFTRSRYQADAAKFIKHGYPKEKIIMSYATTTTGGMTEGGSRVSKDNPAFYPAGYKGIFDSANPDADRLPSKAGDCFYFLTGFEQSVWRAQYMVDNGLGGVFYWDLGNDLPASHPYSLARGASYAVNSNVEPLVTSVPSAAPSPEADGDGPVATDDPDDQGGFNPDDAREAINAALALYAREPGFHAPGAEARRLLLAAVNEAQLAMNDGQSVMEAINAYLASAAAGIAGPRSGAAYNIIGISSGDDTRRFLHTDANGTASVTVTAPADSATNKAFRWIATVNEADGTFTLCNGLGQYLSATSTATTADAASAARFPLLEGNALGRLQLSPADGAFYETRYNQKNTTDGGIGVVIGKDSNCDNPTTPLRWTGQWLLQELEPISPELHSIVVSGEAENGGVMINADSRAVHGDMIYVDPAAAVGIAPSHWTSGSCAIDSDAKTLTVSYGGLSTRKAYRFDIGGSHITMTDGDRLIHSALEDSADPAQIFTLRSAADGKFALNAQGSYVGATPDVNNTAIAPSSVGAAYHVIEGSGNRDGKFAFDRALPAGGSWAGGSRAIFRHSDGYISAWGTGVVDSWWTPTEVNEITVSLTPAGKGAYAAVCFGFDVVLPADGLRAYVATANDGTRLTASLITSGIIPADTPAILVSEDEAETTATLPIGFSNVKPVANLLSGNYFACPTPANALTLGTAPDGTPAFVETAAPTLPRNGAYIVAPATKTLPIDFDDDEMTSISQVAPAESAAPTAIFDLQGRRLSAPARGINIVNGKKLIVR